MGTYKLICTCELPVAKPDRAEPYVDQDSGFLFLMLRDGWCAHRCLETLTFDEVHCYCTQLRVQLSKQKPIMDEPSTVPVQSDRDGGK
jgi:hypothetical protein